MRIPLLVLATAFASGALAQPAKPAKLGLCSACHGEDGHGREPGIPHLAAQDETYLQAALEAYRAGTREHAAMHAIAGTLSATDIRALARWYSEQRELP